MKIRQNSIKAWVLAARPKTLAAAAAPVCVGGAYAMNSSFITYQSWIPFVLCLLFSFLMQIDANFINDYYDNKKGSDRQDRLGPERACAQGWVTEKAMKKAIAITSVLACLDGLPLIYFGGWALIGVGAVCLVGAWLYTTRLSYLGWGDVMVWLFFGIIPVVFTYYPMTKNIDVFIVLLGVATGFVIDDLLIINNYRDRNQDVISGKKTIVVRLGERFGLLIYWYIGSIGAVISYVVLWYKNDPWCLLLVVYLIFHYLTFKKMKKTDGKALNKLLAETSRNIMIFAIVTCIGLLL